MDIERLFRRAWDILWNNKWLIILGFLIVLGTISGGGNPGGQYQTGGGDFPPPDNVGTPGPGDFNPENFDPGAIFEGMTSEEQALLAVGVPIAIALCGLLVLLKIALWVISRIAAGALIAGVDQIEGVGASSFGQAWRVGWRKGWRLIGIGLIVALPLLAALLVVAALVVPAINIANDVEDIAQALAGGGLALTAGMILCLGFLVTAVLSVIGGLADRACITEDTGVFDSYRRAWEVVTANFGQVLILALVHFVSEIIIGIVLIVPSIMIACCCILWPLGWAIQGSIRAYFMTLWTLAWRDWTGRTRTGELLAQPVPGV